ncbi:DUF1697 domain-containing protein [Parabacteroides sp. PF5-9]|uniref:DUF1697 domain-containing protein n=1 Tax=Parabacteroides sp. PF5-9 TaxID=1742404 RepID=UPI002477078C|nr:DUF1697 domain-containing protein [Parabacteroides sp. PF5-9]MDH6358138.1 uncharacterized protein (DUF1697 family) [Parabacteroides sp. PF5-9]
MNRYIVFLRGINVGGNATISMATLKHLLTNEGYSQVDTYLNSGNVILETKKSKEDTEKHLQQLIEQQWGLTVAVFVKSKEDLEFILANNPFDSETESDNSKRMVVMFHETISSGRGMVILKDEKEDADYYLKDNLIYIYYKVGVGRAKVTNPTIKQLLKRPSTSRNWNTMTKIVDK